MPRTLLPAFATTVVIVLTAPGTNAAQVPAVRPITPTATPATKPHAPAQRSTPVTRPASRRRPPKRATFSRVQIALQHTPTLASAVMVRLPAGVDLMEVSAGFQDLGQFVAAVNASRTL